MTKAKAYRHKNWKDLVVLIDETNQLLAVLKEPVSDPRWPYVRKRLTEDSISFDDYAMETYFQEVTIKFTSKEFGHEGKDPHCLNDGRRVPFILAPVDFSTWTIINLDGYFRYVNHELKLATTGFAAPGALERNADIIRTDPVALNTMSKRYQQIYNTNKDQ